MAYTRFSPEQLVDEVSIVWDEDPATHRYVREALVTAHTRTRPVRWDGPGRRIGYAVLAKDAPNDGQPGYFQRRLFWLRDTDPYAGSGAPCEGVDPLTVQAGVPGVQNDRAWGKPLPLT